MPTFPGFLFDDSAGAESIQKAFDSVEAAWVVSELGSNLIAKSTHKNTANDIRYLRFLDKSDARAIIVLKKSAVGKGNGDGDGDGGVKKGKYTNAPWVDPTPDLNATELGKCVPTAVLAYLKRYSSIEGSTITKSMLVYPYKTADGRINLNATKKIITELTKNSDLWNHNMPPSVCKAIVTELREVAKAAVAKISHDVSFISKADTLKRGLVYGLVYEPLVKDSHEDFATAEEIEAAAHNYLPSAMQNVEHDSEQTLTKADSTVVESYIAPCDFNLGESLVTKGSWILVTKIHTEELLEKVRSGEITGYSMEGTAFKV